MKKGIKYYGEVWYPDNENEKQFAIISFKDDDLQIETSLHSARGIYKESQIMGAFNGIGFVTFIDCQIQYSSSGLMETRIYYPKYSFLSAHHFIDAINTELSEFLIVNDAIVKWVNHMIRYNNVDEKLLSKQFDDHYYISEKGLSLKISQFQNFNSKRTELIIANKGSILFNTEKPIGILEAIDIYDQFQKTLQLLLGGSAKFESFSFKCLSCGEWQQVYYNDTKLTKSTRSYVHTEYEKVKVDLDKIFNAVYSDENFQFCLDKLMENFISNQVSHNKRFTNSIATFEAFCKLYSGHKLNNLSRFIRHYKEVFLLIGKFNEEEWKLFPSKVVRSRDYHIHSNTANKNVFNENELLYISFLFDFVIGYLLLQSLNVCEELLQRFIIRGNNIFINGKRTNEILSKNPLVKMEDS